MGTAQEPVKLKNSRNPLLYIFITVAVPFLMCNFFAIIAVSVFAVVNTENNVDEIEQQEVTSLQDNLDLPEETQYRPYLDPDIDSEADDFVVKSLDTFTFSVVGVSDPEQYGYEREFILANLQSEYEKMSVMFDYGFEREIMVELTDDQDYYEEESSFDYIDELPYAGLTTTDKVLFFINPNTSYSKLGFKNVISHELVHLFQLYSVEDGLYNYPKWFMEGTAEYFSKGQNRPLEENENYEKFTSLDIVNYAIDSGDLQNTRDAYNTSYHYVNFLVDTYGEEKLLKLMLPDVPFPAFYFDFEQIYGVKPDVVYENWHRLQTDLPPETYEGSDIDRSYDEYVQYLDEITNN